LIIVRERKVKMGDWLKNRVAVITGSGQGIGKALAIGMAKEGARVVTNNRRPGTSGGDAETVAKEIIAMGGQAVPFFGSVSEFDGAQRLIQAAVDNFGGLDIVVNNAGADAPRMVWNMTEEDWDRCVDSFLKGSFNCIRFAAPLMREKGWGRIINTTSTAWLGTVGHCNYGAAKAGLVGLTRAVAWEVGRYEELTNPPAPETVNPFIIYLCTDAAADINGQVFDVTGGDIALYSEPVKKNTITKKEGLWTVEELTEQVSRVLLKGYKNPAPPQQK
jgi:3-oxoacyl-[acyl-carrier protein] reductase